MKNLIILKFSFGNFLCLLTNPIRHLVITQTNISKKEEFDVKLGTMRLHGKNFIYLHGFRKKLNKRIDFRGCWFLKNFKI